MKTPLVVCFVYSSDDGEEFPLFVELDYDMDAPEELVVEPGQVPMQIFIKEIGRINEMGRISYLPGSLHPAVTNAPGVLSQIVHQIVDYEESRV